jgi:hypothetical protein
MTVYQIVHFQNPAPAHENVLAAWLRRELGPRLRTIPGVESFEFAQLQAVQMQPANTQPWRLATVLSFTANGSPTATLASFGRLARRAPREAGLLQDDATHVFTLTRNLHTHLPMDEMAPRHLVFMMDHCIEGKEVEYDAWYDNLYGPEVLSTPDFVGMRRGILSPDQLDPDNAQPANRLVLLEIHSHDLYASIDEYIARANGFSPSGVRWSPPEAAAKFFSLKRDTHVFTPFSRRLFGQRKTT